MNLENLLFMKEDIKDCKELWKMKIGQWQKRYNALSDYQFWEIAYGENC